MYSVTSTATYFLTRKVKNRHRTNVTRNKSIIVDPTGNELRLNVSGFMYRLHESFLNRFPDTLLGSNEKDFFYDEKLGEYFFDRDPHIFRLILKFYKTGQLHCSDNDCHEAFADELMFFGIMPEDVAACCGDNFFYISQKSSKEKKKKKIVSPKTFREKCWIFCEDPTFSLAAKCFYYFSCLVITLSIVVNTVETVECRTSVNNTAVFQRCSDAHPQIFFVLDSACVTFFALEYMFRFYSTDNRYNYLKNVMSIIDILAILPFFVDLILFHLNVGTNVVISNILVAFRSVRIIRVFKLARHSQRLRVLSSSIYRSTSELGFILFMYINVVVMFATCIFYAENSSAGMKSAFSSIPEAMWYTVVTTTTLGYGDVVPVTIQGKLIGSMCCLMGVLVIALPVPIIQMKASEED
uniref:Potassium channel gamma subunit n=1 Tax=Polyorchis penicillatus TaxID=6091 RepID=P91783_POLPE|nr:potassium channel gamma subunit [Polyorchis penicillatus]